MPHPVHTKRGTTKRAGESGSALFGMQECLKRILVFRLVLFCVALLLVARLYQLAVLEEGKWTALAENQHTLSHIVSAERGEILIRDGDGTSPVAVNREYKLVYIVPREIEDVARTALELSAVLGLNEQDIRQRIENRRDDPFEAIKKRISGEEENRLKELKLAGVYFLPELYRYYPAGEVASKVIGFVSPGDGGDFGIYGVESSFNGELHGKDGNLSQEKDAAGRWIPLTDREKIEAVDGDSVVLTLDRVIQYEVEQILADELKRHEADQISAIVMEPKTGKILAMAGLPQFDPNAYGQVEDQSRFMNAMVSLPYEAGSVLKPITMAIGIEEGKITPNSEFVDTGVIVEAGYAIRNAEDKVYGRSTMTKVLEESINTGVMHVERLVGNARFREYLERFGFGSKTGIRLPAEHAGNMKNLSNTKSTIQFYTASFGQGITVTPIQLVASFAALANGGVLMRPEIVDRIIRADGTIVPVEPREVRRVVSQETARSVGEMLRSVVVNGHGKRADVPGYKVVGKTGTAQVAKQGSRGYEDGINIGSFVGYAPLDDPRYVVLIKVDNPKGVLWAESSAAPTFGRIMQFLLSYGKVQPTETLKTQ